MNDVVKIDKKIVGYRVKKEEPVSDSNIEPQEIKPIGIHEGVEREEVLIGKTYKIKPNNKHGFYITINNITIEGKLYPFEIFINTKDTQHFEWVTILTRLVSAVFRKGGDVSFIIEEFAAVHNPNDGYWSKNKVTGKGKYYKSIVNEIGDVIALHLDWIEEQNNSTIEHIARVELQPTTGDSIIVEAKPIGSRCNECGEHQVVRKDNCDMCLSCGASKCG